MSDSEQIVGYRKAAQLGDAAAQFNLGWCYSTGRGVTKDDAEAVKWYRKAAEQGNRDAQCNLGWMYEKGRGVPECESEALKWYHKAAEQNEPYAQNNLGCRYRDGRGVPKNEAEAAKWYRKAAEQGNKYAQFNLGWMYRNGSGVPQDDGEAVKWYREAAEQGDSDAQNNLGWMFENGKGVPKDKAEAVRWYREAARQGQETAKGNLARMNVPVEEEQILDKVSPPQRRNVPRADTPLRESADCKTLLDACTPLVYRHNAFRITGLVVDASTRDIKRRIDDLRHAEEMGDAEEEHTHAFALNPPPSLDHIREAAQRLQDSERRIVEEFFWFWPTEWGNGKHDPALSALASGDKDTAFKTWSQAISDDQSAISIVAKHNLAVMYQLVALDSEHIALESDLSADSLETVAKYWRKCFKWWEELTDDEAFWSLVADRIRVLDDKRLTTGFARRMRATLAEALDKINAMLAISFVERGKLTLAANHINYMKETHQGRDNVLKTLAVITKPLKTRVRSAVEKATSTAQRQPGQAAESARELLQAVAGPLHIIQVILPPEDHERIDLCDAVAEACLTCQTAYARETKDWETSLEILDAAIKFSASKETKTRLSEKRNTVANERLFSQYLDPLAKRIKEIQSKHSIVEKVKAVESDVLPQLRSIERLPGMTADVYTACADFVANFVRELSVSAYNQDNDLAAAIRILDIAVATARGREACDQLQKDKAQLAGIRAEATEHNLHIQIRSDDIEVTNEFVRYNDRRIPVSEVKGIKFGVFVQYTNGIKSSSSYLIDITGGQAEYIRIECKRFFRSEAQAEQDFNNIIKALVHQVVPSLVERLAEGIVAGRPLQMGDCRLTAEGMYITTGSLWWKKETLVPYSDLRFGNHQGHLNVSSAKDKKISASMALRDAWNAVFFEFIVKAVVELKSGSRTQPPPILRSRQ
jgi:TPR repeat protein